jgi:DNA-binding NtrC family response regulator
MAGSVLLIDDDVDVLRSIGSYFERQGYEVTRELSGEAGLATFDRLRPEVVILDLRLPGMNGMEVLEELRQRDAACILLTGEGDVATAVRAMQLGAENFLTKPVDMEHLAAATARVADKARLRRINEALLVQSAPGHGLDSLGTSSGMQDFAHQVALLAQSERTTVLLTGESGTGKGWVARMIHDLSPRAKAPFVEVNCAGLNATFLDSELFGHEKGAFTGAIGARRGRFEVADQGTLFLDEIGDLALGLQSKLLRVLQQRSFERLGSNSSVTVNIRLVCATHRNLEEMVKQNTFREDLYYRLNVVQLHLPPLRERRDGIPVLAHHFLEKFGKQFGKKTRRFSHLAMRALEEHAWPGNVRELENVVQRAVVIAEGPVVEIWHLPTTLRNGFEQPQLLHPFEEEVRDFKRRLIVRTLRECGGRKAEAARTLGLARGYLHRLINQLQIQPEELETGANSPEDRSPTDRVM